MTTIDKKTYLSALSKADKKEFIDENQYSDEYIQFGLAYCGLHYQKNRIVQINGLISFKKGDGALLIKELQKKHKYLRLNCLGESLERYYSKLGFKPYLKLRLYTEMFWTREDY